MERQYRECVTVRDGCDGIFDSRGGIKITVTTVTYRHVLSRTVTERMDKMGNVQISQELFMQLLRFHLVEDESCEKEIKQGLEKKLDRMVMRDLYGKFKTAPTEEERERARKEYLDRRGVPESFRW